MKRQVIAGAWMLLASSLIVPSLMAKPVLEQRQRCILAPTLDSTTCLDPSREASQTRRSEAKPLAKPTRTAQAAKPERSASSAKSPSPKLAKSSKAQVHREIDHAIQKASLIHDMPAELVKALVSVESGGGPLGVTARNGNNHGLTQLAPETARQMGVTDLLDVEQNIVAGSGYLKKWIDHFDSLYFALVAYNWGPRNAELAQQRQKPVPKSVTRYAQKVMDQYFRLQAKSGRS